MIRCGAVEHAHASIGCVVDVQPASQIPKQELRSGKEGDKSKNPSTGSDGTAGLGTGFIHGKQETELPWYRTNATRDP